MDWITFAHPAGAGSLPGAGIYHRPADLHLRWPSVGNYTATIEHPDGRVEPDSFNQIDRPDACNLYLESVMPPLALGTYTLQFDDFGHMRHSIDVVAPDGPRFYVLHVGNQGSTDLFLHNFRPNEAVRIYEYRQEYDMLRLVGWQAHHVDANGQLYLSTRYCISAICQSGPDYYEPSFIVIGDESGEVREFTQIPTDVRPLQSIVLPDRLPRACPRPNQPAMGRQLSRSAEPTAAHLSKACASATGRRSCSSSAASPAAMRPAPRR